MLKIFILLPLIIFISIAATYITDYVINVRDTIYAKDCLFQSVDQVVKVLRHQQIILSDLGIPYEFNINRNNFNRSILTMHRNVIKAYWDLDKRQHKVSKSHFIDLKESYTDNISTLNSLLADYNIYAISYNYSKDKCYLLNKIFEDYPLLDEDIQYRMDNGIESTGVIQQWENY